MRVLVFLCFSFTILARVTAEEKPIEAKENGSSFTYVPLENEKKDLDCLHSYWPMKEDAFIADLHSLDATRWVIIVCGAQQEYENGESDKVNNKNDDSNTEANSSSSPFTGHVGGLLNNEEALEEVETLKNYIDEHHVITSNDHQYRYANLCLSYRSPINNRSMCNFPNVDPVQILKSPSTRGSKSFHRPVLYPLFGDKGVPLGLKVMTGPLLGDVQIDQVDGEVKYVKWVALKYFLRTNGDIDGISKRWRDSLRDYVLNKYSSNVIQVLYLDDEMMKLRLDEKRANANLVSRLLDPTSSVSPGSWSNGLTAQLIFNAPIDLSREAEVKRVLKALSAFENTPYTFGQEGTVCWIRTFLEWKKWLAANLYSSRIVEGENENDQNENTGQEKIDGGTDEHSKNDGSIHEVNPNGSIEEKGANEGTEEGKSNEGKVSSPFGSFREDLRVFLQNPNYPVYSKHVVLNDVVGAGLPDVKAFRCLLTLKNLTSPAQRKQALQYLREIILRYPGYNMSIVAMDFFPSTGLSAPLVSPRFALICFLIFGLLFSRL